MYREFSFVITYYNNTYTHTHNYTKHDMHIITCIDKGCHTCRFCAGFEYSPVV